MNRTELFKNIDFYNIQEARQLLKIMKNSIANYGIAEKELRQKIKAYEKHVETDTDSEVWKK